MATKTTNRKDKPALRPVKIETGVNMHAEGSALITMGNTVVMCTASVEKRLPDWLKGKGKGWVTAEYGMLPRSTSSRMSRERNKAASRSLEISRLVGRALRASVDMERLGENLVAIDCDVLQADGGTRTASITGGMVALALAVDSMTKRGLVVKNPITSPVAAVSVGIVDGAPVLDLDYEADHRAEVDMNVAMNAKGELVEVQGSAEGKPFRIDQLHQLVDLAAGGIRKLIQAQRKAIAEASANK